MKRPLSMVEPDWRKQMDMLNDEEKKIPELMEKYGFKYTEKEIKDWIMRKKTGVIHGCGAASIEEWRSRGDGIIC